MSDINKFSKDKGRGQPRKLTKELIAEFAKLLPAVAFLETIGDILCVDRTTWRKWIRRGRKEWDRLAAEGEDARVLESEQLYLDFFAAYRHGLAAAQIQAALLVDQAARSGVWQAAAWKLERLFPDRWGSQTREIRILEKALAALEKELAELRGEKATRPRRTA